MILLLKSDLKTAQLLFDIRKLLQLQQNTHTHTHLNSETSAGAQTENRRYSVRAAGSSEEEKTESRKLSKIKI